MTFFPPSLRMLLAWTTIFRSGGTLRNYLGYVKTGCIIVGVSTGASCKPTDPARFALSHLCKQVFDEPAMRKAKASVDKGRLFRKRPELWLQRHALTGLSAFRFVLAHDV